MDLQTRKLELIQAFLNVESEDLITSIENLLKRPTTKPNDDHRFKPMTMEEYNARIDKSMEDSKNGRVINAEELLKETDQW